MRDLLLIGAGGLARETAEAVAAINAVEPTWRLLGFLDDDRSLHGQVVGETSVLGPIEMEDAHPDAKIAICTARPTNYVSRQLISQRLDLADERYAVIIHPSTSIGRTCRIGAGSILLSHVDLTANVSVGRHVCMMPQVILTHDVEVEDWATINSGVRLGGGCVIGRGAYIGSAACLREEITVGERAMIGMGSLVTRDVGPERLWYGAPARDVGPAPLPSESSHRTGRADARTDAPSSHESASARVATSGRLTA